MVKITTMELGKQIMTETGIPDGRPTLMDHTSVEPAAWRLAR